MAKVLELQLQSLQFNSDLANSRLIASTDCHSIEKAARAKAMKISLQERDSSSANIGKNSDGVQSSSEAGIRQRSKSVGSTEHTQKFSLAP